MLPKPTRWLIAASLMLMFISVLLIGMASSSKSRRIAEATPPLHFPLPGLPPIRGFCMQLCLPGHLAVYERSVRHLKAMGCNWVNLVVNSRQKGMTAEHIELDAKHSLSPVDIRALLQYTHTLHMQAMMMPIVLLDHATGSEWRGAITPKSWPIWFAGYRRYIVRTARWAQAGHVKIFSVGSELLTSESHQRQWLRIVAAVRRVFHGKLTYSSNWDHYGSVKIWKELDYIGMNSYYDLGRNPHTPVGEIMATWRPIQRNLLAYARRMRKPLLITETGWDNLQNTLEKPWDYVGTGRIEPGVQARAYEAYIRVWRHQPPGLFAGVFFWEWWPGTRPTHYGAYSLQGEPVLPLVKHWISGR